MVSILLEDDHSPSVSLGFYPLDNLSIEGFFLVCSHCCILCRRATEDLDCILWNCEFSFGLFKEFGFNYRCSKV